MTIMYKNCMVEMVDFLQNIQIRPNQLVGWSQQLFGDDGNHARPGIFSGIFQVGSDTEVVQKIIMVWKYCVVIFDPVEVLYTMLL